MELFKFWDKYNKMSQFLEQIQNILPYMAYPDQILVYMCNYWIHCVIP